MKWIPFLILVFLVPFNNAQATFSYSRTPDGLVSSSSFSLHVIFDSADLPAGCSGRTHYSTGGYLIGSQSTRQFVATDSWHAIGTNNDTTETFSKALIVGVDGAMPGAENWKPQSVAIFCTNENRGWTGADVAFTAENNSGAVIFEILDPSSSSQSTTSMFMSTTTDLIVGNTFQFLYAILAGGIFLLVMYLFYRIIKR